MNRQLVLKAVHSDNKTATYNGEGQVLVVSNDGASSITVTVNGIIVPILSGEVLGPDELQFGRFKSITVTATTTAYRVFVYDLGDK
jgi:hypothetical protein